MCYKQITSMAALGAVLAMTAACEPAVTQAELEASARTATVGALAQIADPSSVTIKDIQAGAAKIEWRAETPAGNFSCDSDELFRAVDCSPVAG